MPFPVVEAFTQSLRRLEMSKQDNAAQKSEKSSSTNMMQTGPGLDYLQIWEPIDAIKSFTEFEEWLKANMSETIVDDFDQHMKNLDVENKYEGFCFKEVNHPSLPLLVKGEETYGDITLWCLPSLESKPIVPSTDTITFVIGTRKKEKGGWEEMIVGWPEDTTIVIPVGKKADQTKLPDLANPAPVAEKFRPSAFQSTNATQKGADLKLIDGAVGTLMDAETFVNWMVKNAANKEHLNDPKAIRRIVLDSPVLQNRNPRLDLRFYVNVRLHAKNKTVLVGREDAGVSGFLDVVVTERVSTESMERRQVALFSFLTYPTLQQSDTLIVQTPQLHEKVLSYIQPHSRGTVMVEFDPDQPYTFQQFSDMFKAYDTFAAEQLNNYQLEVRNILRRLYGKEPGTALYLKAWRLAAPRQHDNGAITAGVIVLNVYDKYQQMDEGVPLLQFKLITGLQSDTFIDRNVELVQGCECEAAQELDRQLKDAKEEARMRTLEAVGLSTQKTPVDLNWTQGEPAKRSCTTEKNLKKIPDRTATTFKTGSFAFFKGTITGLFPLMQKTEADRVSNFVDYLANEYALEGEHGEVFEVTYLDHDHIAIVVTEYSKVAFCLELNLK
jgi:hypothetical protein